MTEWISIKEKLPKNNQKVLVFSKDGRILYPEKGHVFVAECKKYGRNVVVWNTYSAAYETEMVDVTHWAKFPKPPKDKS